MPTPDWSPLPPEEAGDAPSLLDAFDRMAEDMNRTPAAMEPPQVWLFTPKQYECYVRELATPRAASGGEDE